MQCCMAVLTGDLFEIFADKSVEQTTCTDNKLLIRITSYSEKLIIVYRMLSAFFTMQCSFHTIALACVA